MRICSLLPSATEILYALGLGDSVVGVTHECDFPPEASKKPRLIRPRVDPLAGPAEVDEQVRELVDRGESLYGVDDVLLRALEPDLIVTQDLCHVCAASPDDLATALTQLSNKPRVLSLTPHTLADVWDDIQRIGAATRRDEDAKSLVSELKQRVAALTEMVANVQPRPSIACLDWLDPLYVAGHWVPQMVSRAGGEDVLGVPGEASFRVSWKQVLGAQPQVVVLMPCGYGLARTIEEFKKLKLPAKWEQIPAVHESRIFAVDANSYFSRPGPRLAEGIAILAHIFHPEAVLPEIPPHSACAL